MVYKCNFLKSFEWDEMDTDYGGWGDKKWEE